MLSFCTILTLSRFKKLITWKNGYGVNQFASFLLIGLFLPQLLYFPFLYLALNNTIVITEKEITASPYWSFTDYRYSWEAVELAEVGFEANESGYYGSYMLYFADGTEWELWEDDSSLSKQITTVDKIVDANEIYKEYWNELVYNDIDNWSNEGFFSVEALREIYTVQ